MNDFFANIGTQLAQKFRHDIDIMPDQPSEPTYEVTISNSNWTSCCTIQGVIERVISKSDEREARGRFEITSTITP